jgi:hypothetical protein
VPETEPEGMLDTFGGDPEGGVEAVGNLGNGCCPLPLLPTLPGPDKISFELVLDGETGPAPALALELLLSLYSLTLSCIPIGGAKSIGIV